MRPGLDAAREPVALLYLAEDGDAAAACRPVAGLPLGYRALMTAVRAGCRRVAVPAALRRTAIEDAILRSPAARAAAMWRDDGALAAIRGPVLLVPATVVLPPSALASLLAADAPAVLATGPASAPVALLPAPEVARLAALSTGGEPTGRAVRVSLSGMRARPVAGSWCIAAVGTPARLEAERRLYADLGSAIDTRLDTVVHRPCSRRLTALALRAGLSANTVSLGSLVLGLASAASLTGPTIGAALLGLLLYFLSVVLDHSDGEVARLGFTESRLGEWLDVSIDTLVHSVSAVALGIAAERAAGWGLWAGAAAGVGFAASAFVTKAAPPPAAGDVPARILASLGVRDGFYLLLVLHVLAVSAAPQAIPYLILLAAIGAHAFWPVSLVLRGRTRHGRPETSAARVSGRGR